MAKGTSPASSGPAGSHFEGQVGAHYLLSLLTGAEPRGMPGTTPDRIAFQRAAEGWPLDDVVVHAHDTRGEPAILEVQVKRSISFSPTDPVFRAVVGQIAEASRRVDFMRSRYELAIATARTSRKIDGAYQDVLTWARQLGDAPTFMARINRPGSASDDMRTFVRTFKTHIGDAGARHDDEAIWGLLRRLQILVFDFTARGSVSEELAKERATRALYSEDALHAGTLWTTLVELALQIAASGGDRTRDGLVDDLRLHPFRLASDRRHSVVRAALAEASRNALADIGDRVGNVILTRHERVAAVHAGLDRGRYVEIRGDAGVGKSGVLKHFAEQITTEAQAIVLIPGRTTPRGWTAMRAELRFDGTAYDLLSDLAADGGGILFVDNLELFQAEERTTVVDLVREAASVPGFVVVTTARRHFGVEEPNWLPSDALDRLGRAEPIVIGELSDAEIDELRHAAPKLAGLLADSHPARDVTRNLFRLARLANRPGDQPVPRSEADMAQQWWQTADGSPEGNRRERTRVLRALAEQVLSRTGPVEVSGYQASAVDALVASETLRDLGNDRVEFRHDVLREWAIANLLHSDPTTIEHLPLDRPASAAMTRGTELASRMAVEHAVDSTRWQLLLERLSHEGTHGSWRRAALLALVRSEVSTEVLTRASDFLLSGHAHVLRELIRVVIAVDAQPASRAFAAAGLDTATIPASLNIPSGPSWHRLIRWLLSPGQNLPGAAIPELVDLYTAWAIGTFGLDPLTPSLLQWLFRWLTEIEAARDADTFQDLRELFGGQLSHEQIRSLESDLRTGFLLFCNRTPQLATEYLHSLPQRRRSEDAVRSILTFRGALAQAAPAELAELTVDALIPTREPDAQYQGRSLREPFTFLDLEFLPDSPSQGPFLELLIHAPQHGLSLIHRLVNHAISFYTAGRDYGADSLIIPLSDVGRVFPWKRSYVWSREGTGHHGLTSALMALEAWGHRRIEAGETFDEVLADVLGPPDSPAAYLLVAVDLLLSHSQSSRAAALPFLACPELLCIDRERHAHDTLQYPDIFGFRTLQKDPIGAVSLAALKKRPSRSMSLDQALGQYAVFGFVALRDTLTAWLRRAAERLGPPTDQDDLGDPAFMVTHALNLVDPRNWRERLVTLPNGTQDMAHEYVPPEAESRHLAALQEDLRPRLADANMQASLGLALEDPARSSPELAAAAVEWAQRSDTGLNNDGQDPEEKRIRDEAVITAAMIAMRDGDIELRSQHEAWARAAFARALQTNEDPTYRFRSGLRFNPIAIAFVGMIYALQDHLDTADLRSLLEVAGRTDPAAAHGFGSAATALATVDERLPRAVLRCAFLACIRHRGEPNLFEDNVSPPSTRLRQRVRAAVDDELAWLAHRRPEPDWPAFPAAPVQPRRRLRMSGKRDLEDLPARPSEYADHQAAALWLANLASLADVLKRPWLRNIARTYAPWTGAANGAGLDMHGEVANPPREWNDAYFDLLARCLPELAFSEIESLALARISSLPDESFFEVVTHFVRSIDTIYFNDRGLQESIAVSIRSEFSSRLMASSGWKRLAGSRSASIERRVGSAVAVLFFNDYSSVVPTNCYLLPNAVSRLDPFLPVLERLVKGAPSLFVAIVTLNLLEVSLKPAHLGFLVMAARAWLDSYSDNRDFWVGHGIGRRVCVAIEEVRRQEPVLLDIAKSIRFDIDRLLAALIVLGVPEARRLEQALAGESGDRA